MDTVTDDDSLPQSDSSPGPGRKETLTQALERLEQAGNGEQLAVRDMVHSVNDRGFGPLILLPALITFLPTGGIPGVPAVAAMIIVIVSAQMLLGWQDPWLPKRVMRLTVERQRFVELLRKSHVVTRRIDKVIRPRMQWVVSTKGTRLVGFVTILVALSMIPTGLIPFLTALPSGFLVILSVGLVARDGLLVLIGMAMGGASIAMLPWLLQQAT